MKLYRFALLTIGALATTAIGHSQTLTKTLLAEPASPVSVSTHSTPVGAEPGFKTRFNRWVHVNEMDFNFRYRSETSV